MPEDGKPVLITDVEGLQIVARLSEDDELWHSENHSWWSQEVAYWMHIPEIV